MTRKVFVFELLLIALALIATAIAWPHLPASIPTHWNMHLQPDSYSGRGTLFVFGPGIMAMTMILTLLLPWLSPDQFEVSSFHSTYHQVMLMLFCMMGYVYTVMLWTAIGHPFNAGRAILGGCCLFIALIGNVMGKVRRNFYLGVRTPWTLASERVWNDTHRFAAKTFVAAGLAGLVFACLGLDVWPLGAIIAGALAPVFYSLVHYKQLERRGEIGDNHPYKQGEL
jgi:uncharacterized membrane protein